MKLNKRSRVSVLAFAAAASLLMGTPVMATESNVQSPYIGATVLGSKGEQQPESSLVKIRSGFIEKDDKTIYLDSYGQRVTGWLETEDNNTYYFNEDGEMQTGLQIIEDRTFGFDENGVLADGELTIDDTIYSFQKDGELLTGWNKEEDGTKYYDEKGFMTVGAKSIDGKRYLFDDNGIMQTNVTVEGYKYDENGVGTVDASRYQMIADAALAQLGVYQDCTMLVTNSLKAVGINFHGAPYKYLSLGPTTDNPVPGDIIVYQGHVAIYIGNGQAVHGGWNGNQTAIWSVNCSQPFIAYVHPVLP